VHRQFHVPAVFTLAKPGQGQANFTSSTAATTQSGMRNPQGATIDPSAHLLFVADTANHRVTIFDVASVTNGENATGVLGQADFTGGSPATSQDRMNSPRGLIFPYAASPSEITTNIGYGYDGLHRLNNADYDGEWWIHYTYDAVGNRLTEEDPEGTTNYGYDIARAASRAEGEGQSPYKCGRCDLHLGQ